MDQKIEERNLNTIRWARKRSDLSHKKKVQNLERKKSGKKAVRRGGALTIHRTVGHCEKEGV